MKKITFLAATCFYTFLAFGQTETNPTTGTIDSTNSPTVSATAVGETFTNGLTVDGAAGQFTRGVLLVKASRTHPDYNPALGEPLSIISTQSQMGQYPYINYYNGRYNFRVSYDGGVYTKYGLVQASDSKFKENIASLPSTLSKIQSLRGVSFDYKEDVEVTSNESISTRTAALNSDTPMSELQQQIQSEKSRKRIGLIAQEVEKIYPEVVRTQMDGTKGILYSDLVAVLIEGIKELNTQVATLQDQVEALQNEKSISMQNNFEKSALMLKDAVLYQNTPNPFNQETEIAYHTPNDVTASIHIYNLNGHELKSYPLTNNQGYITVAASEFTPGIYIYSLIINNQEVSSKRMVLTK